METDRNHDGSASFRLWSVNHHDPHQSWLQDDLSDVEEKVNLMLNIMEDEGDTFAKRAEMFYHTKPKLVNLLQEIYKSHISLAEKFDRLRCDHCPRNSLSSPLFSDSKRPEFVNSCRRNLHESVCKEGSSSDGDQNGADFGSVGGLINDAIVVLNAKTNVDDDTIASRRLIDVAEGSQLHGGIDGEGKQEMDIKEREKMLEELMLKVGRLVEENIDQKKELIKRNEEKREAIKYLHSHINTLVDENQNLKCLISEKTKKKKKEEESGVKKQKKSKLSKQKMCSCVCFRFKE